MNLVEINCVKIVLIAMFLAATIFGCGSGSPISADGSSPVAVAQNTPPTRTSEVQASEDGNAYMRMAGWPIPSFGEAERQEFEESITTADGRSVRVYRRLIRTSPLFLIIDNPLYFIGRSGKKARLDTVLEYRTNAGIFCYKFLVNDVEFDDSSNKPITRGILYPFAYYDEDGDGGFETLVLSEEDRHGRTGFASEPRIPEWAMPKAE